MRSRSRFERLCAALVHWSELEGTAAQLRRGTERAGRGGASLWGSNGPAGPPGRGQPGTERSSCSCPRSAPPSTATMSNGSGMGALPVPVPCRAAEMHVDRPARWRSGLEGPSRNHGHARRRALTCRHGPVPRIIGHTRVSACCMVHETCVLLPGHFFLICLVKITTSTLLLQPAAMQLSSRRMVLHTRTLHLGEW